MGYTTEFSGHVTIVPPLNADEIAYLKKFNGTRRMLRNKGPYFVDGTGFAGQGIDADVMNHNEPAQGQPNLWCKWIPSDDGTSISWDGAEKFYDAAEWMRYLIEHFLEAGCVAKSQLPLLQANHVVNGEIEACGEASNDRWILIVKGNVVTVKRGRTVYE